jgi:cysteinyl-tRNA synthetase
MKDIFLHNTLVRDKEKLVPREPGKVSMYVCGVTPYDALHIGHARAFMVYDVLRRALTLAGYDVVHVQNVTDVDDKIIARAAQLKISPAELALRYSEETLRDLDRLNCQPAHHYPRVTGHMDEIIEMVQVLVDKNCAYARGGDVYFDVSNDSDYGKLSGQKLEELESGARIEPGEHKDDPLDFALWKAAKPGEPSWDSPWGKGRPGWHIECSAMALHLLGAGFDIHGGARELIFPHHENEVAQSECYLDHQTFANVWWHCGVVQVDGKKMSKSLGNFITVEDALQLADRNVWRLLFLMTHPRSPLDYSAEKMQQSKNTWNRVHKSLISLPDESPEPSPQAQKFTEDFWAALADDLNTPVALATVFDALALWRRENEADLSLAKAVREALESLGFLFETNEAGSSELVGQLMDILIGVRNAARERRDFTTSDQVRDQLKELGIVLEDAVDSTKWHVAGKG